MTRPRTTEQDQVDVWLSRIADWLPEIDVETEAIVDRIHALSKRIVSMMEETLTGFGLTYGEWKVLTTLRWAGPPHRRLAGQLAEAAEVSTGAMTNRLDRLEASGYVRRLADPADRRAVIVELTRKGRDVWEKAVTVQGQEERLIASALNEREKKELNALLRRLMLAFDRDAAE